MKVLSKFVMGVVSTTLALNSSALVFANEDLLKNEIIEVEENEIIEELEEDITFDEAVELDDSDKLDEEIIEVIDNEFQEEVVEDNLTLEEIVIDEEDMTVSWDDLPEYLDDSEYDLSEYPSNAYIENKGEYKFRVFIVDNKTVKLTSQSKEINGIQIIVKNGGKLILDDINIKNVNPDTKYIHNKKESVIFAGDNKDNKLMINNNVKLTTESKGAAVAINQGSKLTINGTGTLTAKGGVYRLDGNVHTGAIIGGEGDKPYGTIIFEDSVNVYASGLDYASRGAAIGAGEEAADNPSFERGSILIKDNVNITAKSDGGAAIGSGYTYRATYRDYEQGSITIQDNANVNAQSFGANTAAIGITQDTKMMQINIKDNAKVIAAVKSDYNPSKYSENLGFGNFVWESGGSAIGVSEQFSYPADVEDVINISGNPTIIAGGNSGGIMTSSGNLNISGGNITIFTRSMSGIGLSSSGLLLDKDEVATGKVNISGKDTKINISARHVVTQEDIDNSGVFNDYEVGQLNQYSYGTGIGYRVRQEFDNAEINIKEADINIESYKGAGIGSMARDDYYAKGTINIFDNTNLNIDTTNGAGIGTGQQANNSMDIFVKNSTLDINSITGSGIGAGTYAGYNIKDNKPVINITVDDSTINARSVDGAGLGGSLASSSKINLELNNSNIRSISQKTGAGIGGGRQITLYDYASADVVINGGFVYAESYHGAGIGGGKVFNEDAAKDNQTNEGVSTEGTLKVTGDADLLAVSNGCRVEPLRLANMDENFYYRDAITAKLLKGSDLTMQSHTLHPDIKRENDIKINVYNDQDELIHDFTLGKHHSSYAYTTMDDDSYTYTENLEANGQERPLYQIEDKELGIEYREEDRHPNKDEYTAVSEYKGKEEKPLDDNTFIMASFLIKYNGNKNTGGEIPVDATGYKENDLVKILNNGTLTKEGYQFVGWTLSEDGSGTVYKENDTLKFVDNDIELFAKWEIKPIVEFTVTYTDGIDDIELFEDLVFVVEEGSNTPIFTGDLTREGYVFVGWSPQFKETVSEDVIYIAQWDSDNDNVPMEPLEPIDPFVPLEPIIPSNPNKPVIPDDKNTSSNDEDKKVVEKELNQIPKTGVNDVTAKMLLMMGMSGLALLTIYLKDRKEEE